MTDLSTNTESEQRKIPASLRETINRESLLYNLDGEAEP
jgi:hypothetical protein